jgi:hypothetical protein
MKLYISTFLLSTILILGCKNDRTPSSKNLDDFPAFYERFHSDPDFQLERITFPLQGLPKQADAETLASGTFRWTRDNWTIQQPIDTENSEFIREFLPLSDDMIIEKLTHKKWGLAITRRFARLDDGWHLIYYSALNKTGSDEEPDVDPTQE